MYYRLGLGPMYRRSVVQCEHGDYGNNEFPIELLIIILLFSLKLTMCVCKLLENRFSILLIRQSLVYHILNATIQANPSRSTISRGICYRH